MRILPLLSSCFALTLITVLVASVASAQPSHVTYQGSLFKDGSAYTGSANFKFAIVDGGVTLWSNDGTSVAGSEPTASVALSVDQGIFTAFLGLGMSALSADDLAGAAAPVLRVWVDTGAGFDQLSDQTISSSAFALRSDSAERSLGKFTAADTIQASAGGFQFPDGSVQSSAVPGGGTNWMLRHNGTNWIGTSGIRTDGAFVGMGVSPSSSYRLYSYYTGGTAAIFGYRPGTGYGVYGLSTSGRGVYGYSSSTSGSNYGVYGETNSTGGIGVYGRADQATGTITGVFGYSASSTGRGVYGTNNSTSGYGIRAQGRFRASSVYTSSSDGWLNFIETTGNLGLDQNLLQLDMPLLANAGANFIDAQTDDGDSKFTVERTGIVRADSSIFAAAHLTGAADFAEMLPGDSGLTPGDVLVIGQDGLLTRSSNAMQRSVVGIYSTQPGFVGGAASEADLVDKIPLAIVGIVPVKVSAENGAIQPGDLLVTSEIPGHAMKHDAPPPGTIVGKALESLSGTGVIRMLVTLQ